MMDVKRQYIGFILEGNIDDVETLKEFIEKHTSLTIRYITASRYYLLIKPSRIDHTKLESLREKFKNKKGDEQ